MKKILITTLIAFLIPFNAIAKTEEAVYIGVDLMVTKHKVSRTTDVKTRGSDAGIGIGLNVKKASTYGKFFIAPGIFFNYNNGEAINGLNRENLKYSIGARADIGYDICDKLSAFAIFGIQRNFLDQKFTTGHYRFKENTWLYGLGAKYAVADNIDLVGSFQYSDYIEAPITSNQIFTFGATYKF